MSNNPSAVGYRSLPGGSSRSPPGSRPDPVHRGHRLDRPEGRIGVPVTIEAPSHRERLRLIDLLHLVDPPVAGDATDAAPHVRAVIEVNEVGKVVHANPLQGHSGRVALADRTIFSLEARILAWQFMQTSVGGTAACAASSTVLWQYRQSMPSSPAWRAWLYGTGWSG